MDILQPVSAPALNSRTGELWIMVLPVFAYLIVSNSLKEKDFE
jgi:hypothetical protein